LEENKLSEAKEWKEKGMAIALKKGEMAIANRLRDLK